MDREGRPARPIGRRHSSTGGDCGPVGLDPHAANDAVASRSAKAGPVGVPLLAFRVGRACRRLVGRWSRHALAGRLRGWGSRRGSRRSVPRDLLGGPFRGRGAGDGATGSSPAWARSRSSGVWVHRQWSSETASPVMPPVRTSVNTPQASRMAATIDARRGPLERRRLAAAEATSARLKTGMAKTGEHHAHHCVRNGLVNDALGGDHGAHHQDDGAHALGPRRPAEEQPPQEDEQPAGDAAEYRGARRRARRWGRPGRPATAAPRRRRRATTGAVSEELVRRSERLYIGFSLPTSAAAACTRNQIGSRKRRSRAAAARNGSCLREARAMTLISHCASSEPCDERRSPVSMCLVR